jgi:hypothetical protein
MLGGAGENELKGGKVAVFMILGIRSTPSKSRGADSVSKR